jgi:hypothetical protein
MIVLELCKKIFIGKGIDLMHKHKARIPRIVVGSLGAILIALVLSLSACASTDDRATLFSDGFEGYSGFPEWTPAGDGGWVNVSIGEAGGDGTVRIMIDDERPAGEGHFVQHYGGGWVALVNDDFSGSDFAFSMTVKQEVLTGSIGLLGRYVSLDSYYALQITDGDTLGLYKMHAGSFDLLGSTAAITYDNSTLYTLTLEFSGSTIRGYFGGTSVSYTDDGTTFGAVIGTGNIGFGGDAGTTGYYDDALVIEN